MDLYQYAPGGCFKQLSDAAGGSAVVYSQYHPGGPAEQLRVLIDPDLVWDQHAPGGCAYQAEAIVDPEVSVPVWVPARAKIHIDFLGGTPQGRAWVDGSGEVAIDTLLGADDNTATGYAPTGYNPANITANGYLSGTPPALIGAARTLVTSAGFTMRVLLKHVTAGAPSVFLLISADGNDAITVDYVAEGLRGESYGGSLSVVVGITNTALGSSNCAAFTIAGSRYEQAGNGSAAASGVIDSTDRPAGNPLVAALIDAGTHNAIQSITIYDPLPDTTGLPGLSVP